MALWGPDRPVLRDYTLELPYKEANEEQARKPAMCIADKGEQGGGKEREREIIKMEHWYPTYQCHRKCGLRKLGPRLTPKQGREYNTCEKVLLHCTHLDLAKRTLYTVSSSSESFKWCNWYLRWGSITWKRKRKKQLGLSYKINWILQSKFSRVDAGNLVTPGWQLPLFPKDRTTLPQPNRTAVPQGDGQRA